MTSAGDWPKRESSSVGSSLQRSGRTATERRAVSRNLTDVADGFVREHRKLIVDRDTKFTRGFRALLASGRVEAEIPADMAGQLAYLQAR